MNPITTPNQTPGTRHPALTPQDRDLLHALINHRTRLEAASALGYSDRHLRRLLNDLCRRLGVSTTHAAVAVASGALNPDN